MSLKDVLNQMKEKLYYSKTITISGIEIELRLLSIYEEQKLSSEAEIKDGMDALSVLNEIRKMTLAYSVKRINDEIFTDIVEIQNGEKVDKKTKYLFLMDVLSDFPSNAIDILFEAYIDLKEESEDKFKNQYKYDWFKTPEQRDVERKKKAEEDELRQKKMEKSLNSDSEEKDVSDVNFKELSKEDIPEDIPVDDEQQ